MYTLHIMLISKIWSILDIKDLVDIGYDMSYLGRLGAPATFQASSPADGSSLLVLDPLGRSVLLRDCLDALSCVPTRRTPRNVQCRCPSGAEKCAIDLVGAALIAIAAHKKLSETLCDCENLDRDMEWRSSSRSDPGSSSSCRCDSESSSARSDSESGSTRRRSRTAAATKPVTWRCLPREHNQHMQ
jgi:hypothetical protein